MANRDAGRNVVQGEGGEGLRSRKGVAYRGKGGEQNPGRELPALRADPAGALHQRSRMSRESGASSGISVELGAAHSYLVRRADRIMRIRARVRLLCSRAARAYWSSFHGI